MATTVPTPGGMLGRYQVLKPLARGGMAEVLLARAIGLAGFERYVVIKRIRVEHGSDQKAIDMFLDEARLVAALHHRNIVQVLDVGEEDKKYFFVMEYVHGRDTRELLRHVKESKAQLPLEHVLTIATAAAAGLHHAHEQRGPDRKPLDIVHRDVSPGNILVAFDGGVKVVDFGIAKAAARAVDTQAGERKGKLGYMAPEQCKAEALDRRTDVFLLGIVLWELVTIRRLYKADTRYETMSMIVDGDVPPPTKFRDDLPAELEAIVLKALAKDPAERYQTADALRLALESFAARAGMPLSPGRLSDYLKEQFGDVPEPWLVDDPVPPPPPEEIARRTSQQYVVAAPPASSEDDAPAPPATSTQPELDAIRAAKPVVEGAPAVADPDEEAEAAPAAPAAPAALAPAAPRIPPEPAAPRIPPQPAAPGAVVSPGEASSGRWPAEPGSMRWPVDPSSARRRRAILIGIGVVVVAAVAFAVIAFSGTDIPATPASSDPGATMDPAASPGSAHDVAPPSALPSTAEPEPTPAAALETVPADTGAGNAEDEQVIDAGVGDPGDAAAGSPAAGSAAAPPAKPAVQKPRPPRAKSATKPAKKSNPAEPAADPGAASPAEPAAPDPTGPDAPAP